MKYTFCPKCSSTLILKSLGDDKDIPFCESCNVPYFPFSTPAIITLVINPKNQIALIKQSYVSENYIVVAGYLQPEESLENCVKREVEEELGLKVSSVKYMNSYPYPKKNMLMIGFVSYVNSINFNISTEVDKAKWFSLEEALDKLKDARIALHLLNDYLNTK